MKVAGSAAVSRRTSTDNLAEVDVVPACHVCGSCHAKEIARGYDYEMETCANEWPVVQCAQCGHAWLNPRPAAAELPRIYPETYYSYDIERRVGNFAMRVKSRLDARKLRATFDALRIKPKNFLDIGCGDGRYLSVIESMGVARDDLFGLEIDERAVAVARDRGYRVFLGNAETWEGFAAQKFDVITLFHVIEHVADPTRLLRRLREWLSDDGVIIMETPNIESADARLFRKRFWGGYHFPRHWHFFEAATIGRCLERAGCTVRSISYQTGHSFWAFSVHHALKYNKSIPLPTLARLFNPLDSLPVLAAATALDLARAALGFRTSAMMVVASAAK
jgi:2-polyprenyl-3-methyl-5-hydroxy-6-metoxy-1,4-benzoquinol methylase